MFRMIFTRVATCVGSQAETGCGLSGYLRIFRPEDLTEKTPWGVKTGFTPTRGCQFIPSNKLSD